MGTVRFHPLLLFSLFGFFQGGISQLPKWTEEVEGSGKTFNGSIMFPVQLLWIP